MPDDSTLVFTNSIKICAFVHFSYFSAFCLVYIRYWISLCLWVMVQDESYSLRINTYFKKHTLSTYYNTQAKNTLIDSYEFRKQAKSVYCIHVKRRNLWKYDFGNDFFKNLIFFVFFSLLYFLDGLYVKWCKHAWLNRSIGVKFSLCELWRYVNLEWAQYSSYH